MDYKEKAKQLVNEIYQPMGYLKGLQMNNKEMWFWASERAIDNVRQIIMALKTTTEHCELRTLDLQEVDSDIKYWEKIIEEIKTNSL